MKAKRVLITYLNNGNLQSQVAKEYLFNKVIAELEAEGRIKESTSIVQNGSKIVTFEDNTKVWLMPFGRHVVGMRFTHLYVDEISLQTPKSKEFINEMYKDTVVNGNYMNFDTSEPERMCVYSFINGTLFKRSFNEYGL